MNTAEATATLRTLADALRLPDAASVVTLHRSEQHTGVVARAAFPWRLSSTMTTTPHDTESDALMELVTRAQSAAEYEAKTADKSAETARNEAQVALLRAAEAEQKAATLRAALLSTLTVNA